MSSDKPREWLRDLPPNVAGKVKRILESVKMDEPAEHRTLSSRAMFLSTIGSYKEAIVDMKKAIDLEPDNSLYQEALTAFEAALEEQSKG